MVLWLVGGAGVQEPVLRLVGLAEAGPDAPNPGALKPPLPPHPSSHTYAIYTA